MNSIARKDGHSKLSNIKYTLAVVGATVTVTEWSDLRYFGLAPGTARLLVSNIRAVNLIDLYFTKAPGPGPLV